MSKEVNYNDKCIHRRKKRKICLLSPSLREGGAERALARLSFVLSEHFDVFIVVFDGQNSSYDTKVVPFNIDLPSEGNGRVISKIVNAIRRLIRFRKFKFVNDIDIVYSFGQTANIINSLSGGNDKKIISIRGYGEISYINSFFKRTAMTFLMKLMSFNADRIVLVSRHMENQFIEKYGHKNKVSTIYNAYNVDEIQSLSKEIIEDNQIESIFKNNKVIITVGNYRHEKGHWHLLKSFKLVCERTDNVMLFICGRGTNEEKEKIEKLSRELNIEERVILLGFKSNVFKYIKKSHIYALSSVSEGFPNAMVESMVCGVPVVANNCFTGPKEILNVVENPIDNYIISDYGILTPQFSKKSNWVHDEFYVEQEIFANALLKYINDENLHSEHVISSKRRAQDFNYKIWLDQHIDLMKEF